MSARNLRTIVRELSAAGTTIVLTTHDMVEADELCHRVAFLSEGRIVALDTPRELKLHVGGDASSARRARVLLSDRTEHEVTLDDPEQDERLSGWLRDGRVLTVHSDEPSLADVFVALAGRSLDEDDAGETEETR
jgi:ABC-2 type transport system ATP-binding protein